MKLTFKLKNFSRFKRPKLSPPVDYQKKVAKKFFKRDFYLYEQDRIENIFKTYLEKRRLRAPHQLPVDLRILDFIEMSKRTEAKVFRVLQNIRNRSITNIQQKKFSKKKDSKFRDLLSILSNPFFLIAAYRTIRQKKGAMTLAQPLPPFIKKT